jgi:hypothetical protein
VTEVTETQAIAGGGSKRLRWSLIVVVVLLLSAVGGVWLYNETVLEKPLQHVLLNDPRNHVVQVSARFDGWVDTHTLVFDLTSISGNASTVDIFRVLLQYAQAQKDHSFTKVILAAYGRKKFVLPGAYFQQLGADYSTENPVYTMRTFAHHVLAMDGSRPFPEVEGGILYVLPMEMEQFTAFNRRWYLNDYLARQK